MPKKTFILPMAILLLAACNSYNLRYQAAPQPDNVHLYADYTQLQDAIGVSIDTDGQRLEEVFIKKSDGTIVRPVNIAYPSFHKSSAVGFGVGAGTGSVGLGTGFGVPVGSDHAYGLTTATFTAAAIGDAPWELHIKVQGAREAVIPAFGGTPNAR
jgi:hypothetical protein